MVPYTAILATQHLLDLQREAEAARLANQAKRSGAEPTDRGGWSRLAARSARGLSAILASLAARIDPDEVPRSTPADERKARPLAA
jgi:hypothetical protein